MKNKKALLLLIVCLALGGIFLTMIFVCSQNEKGNQPIAPETTTNTIVDSKKDVIAFIKKVEKLKEGMKREKVEKVLGKPDLASVAPVSSRAVAGGFYYFDKNVTVYIDYNNGRLRSASWSPEPEKDSVKIKLSK